MLVLWSALAFAGSPYAFKSSVADLEVDATGQRIVGTCFEYEARVWQGGKVVWKYAGKGDDAEYYPEAAADGDLVALAGRHAHLVDLASHQQDRLLSSVDGFEATDVAVSAKAKAVVAVGKGAVVLFREAEAKPDDTGYGVGPFVSGHTLSTYEGSAATFSADGKTAYYALAYAPEVHVVDVATLTETSVWTRPAPVRALEPSPDGALVAAADDTGISVLSLSDGTEKTRLATGSAPSAGEVAWTKDGGHLVTSDGTQITVWNVATGALERTLQADERVNALAVDPARGLVLAGFSSGKVLAWDVATGAPATP